MESLITKGVIHIHGVLLWIAAITMITLELLRAFRIEKGEESKNRPEVWVTLMGATTTILTGSTGLFLLYEWDIWNRLSELTFWWVHSMILTWILFSIVFFLLDPLVLKRFQ